MGRHWRLTRVYGGITRRNVVDSIGDASVVSPCAAVTETESKEKKYCMARSLPVENLLPQNVGSIINYSQ